MALACKLTFYTMLTGLILLLLCNQPVQTNDQATNIINTIGNLHSIKSVNFSNLREIVQHLKSKSVKTSNQYLFFMILALSGDTELNPGPRTPKWPCGTCEKAVTWSQKAICCVTCNIWYHANCQGMPSLNYKCFHSSNLSWHCIQCGMPNFSSSIFDLSSLETSNSFDPLEDQSVGNLNLQPAASSTPKKQVFERTCCKKETKKY
ncbi:unnamed protein product [Mytilus coruscus]|uniref:PHD-type domain-containing protein n=1 Tax=Mytilus coruscus TaxID=42192 RepID=A0A6J8CNA8_MYTCO|nr:unnamed protein product [Mytilus coruscus]